jgi:hypothetical protein
MITVIHKQGTSFKGLIAQYLLHDKDTLETSHRVAWSHVCGMATDDAVVASRIMAATAMQRERLKAQAEGVSKVGRKFKGKPVLHLTLSWSPEERGELTKDEMVRAAEAAIATLGVKRGECLGKRWIDKEANKFKKQIAKRTHRGDEHQAVIVCHDDGPGTAPHVHVAINLVHPRSGLLLPLSRSQRKLSKWALAYRTAQGGKKADYCPQRRRNANKRANNEKTQSHRRKPDATYRAEKEETKAKADSQLKALLAKERRDAQALQAQTDALVKRQRSERRAFEDRHRAATAALRERTRQESRAVAEAIRERYAKDRDVLLDRQDRERKAFEQARGSAVGHVRNYLKAVTSKDYFERIRTSPVNALSRAMRLAVSDGYREADLLSRHRREEGALNGQRDRDIRAAKHELRIDEGLARDGLDKAYLREREALIDRHEHEQTSLSRRWSALEQRRHDRRLASKGLKAGTPSAIASRGTPNDAPDVREQFTKAAQAGPTGDGASGSGGDDDQAAKIKATAERLAEARAQRKKRGPSRGPKR